MRLFAPKRTSQLVLNISQIHFTLDLSLSFHVFTLEASLKWDFESPLNAKYLARLDDFSKVNYIFGC